ncbi:hypothetical protein [Conexibacter woesei]|uniref:Uncharacterized protein n=1 Tax=Conexibacter woesei (strain DSM 14684 / CCUG 47730 / CIP 108061 / JCM 11494 / NBRC 100937 / ID131577) TaxID=469383 RepID=D3F5A9_CONWI|nr:hypothetical protein [Conexibacter woesei]ADB50576.1 hypothetical protein Cwoe_2151 [Conexibacter woesei DSM 14684]
MTTDLIGTELTAPEERLLATYESLKQLCREELPPVAHANVRAALAVYVNAIVSMGLAYEPLLDLEV